MICLSALNYALTIFLSTMGGLIAAIFLLKVYLTSKITPAEAEMARVADYLQEHHPGVIEPGVNMSDITIKLIDHLNSKSKIIT